MYHGSGTPAANAAAECRADARPADELFDGRGADRPSVVLVDASMLGDAERLRRLPRYVVVVAADQQAHDTLGRRAHMSVAGVVDGVARRRLLRAACQLSCARRSALNRRVVMEEHDDELRDLTRIGIGLMAEHDRVALLDKILDVGKRYTRSDAAGLILAESQDGGGQRLRLALWVCDSLPDLSELEAITFPIDDTSIIGHAAATKQLVVVADAYNLPPDAGFAANPAFDKRFGYHRQSMLIVPMIDHIDRLVGVLLFINRKTDPAAKITSKAAADRYVLPYTAHDVGIARSLASHAAVSIENAELYAQIERTLESFVKASVTAIDQHDPTTAGHSVRVATLTMDLAAAIDRADRGVFESVRFTRAQMRELYFAALLHDFGKVSVRDDVLLKAKKLPPILWERIDARFDLIRRTIELDYQRQRTRVACGRRDGHAIVSRLDQALARDLANVDHLRNLVREANEPTNAPTPMNAALFALTTRTFVRPDGTVAPYLTRDELHFLRVPYGTLDEAERAEVEAHVVETYRFLSDIPWGDDLKQLANYAYSHHEKLNGTGYPRRLRGEDIPVQARLLTIADMFDALTESDRPYKPAVSTERALDILRADAASGILDANLVALLVESQAYRKIVDEDWHLF